MILAALLLATATAIPAIDVIDDNGRVRSTSEWRGAPVILAPMYARCPLACPLIARSLERGVAESTASPSSYRVVLFSFDPHDTVDDLRRFRDRQQIPLGWSIVRAVDDKDTRRLLDAVDYRFAVAGNFYTHPNAIIALTPDLRPARFIAGTHYDIDAALAAARGGSDWIGRWGGWALAILLFVGLMAGVYLMTALAKGSTGEVRDRTLPTSRY